MVNGSCLCGAVGFQLEAPLTEVELCHCRKCRKAYGAPFAATLYLARNAFQWVRGEEFVTTYDAPLEESPPAYRHSFCKRCGSPLPLAWSALPFVEVPVASLDDPVSARPVYQMFECHRIDWISNTSQLRWFERGAPLSEKVLRALL